MSAWLRISVALSRAWSTVYTLGLPGSARGERRAEIESDLWEHLTFASGRGNAPVRTALEILLRTMRGMPEDVLWRLEGAVARQGSLAVSQGRGPGAATERRPQDVWFNRNGWVLLIAIIPVLIGGMWLLMEENRPSRLAFAIESPAYLSVGDGEWEIRAGCCNNAGLYAWSGSRVTHLVRVTNHGGHTARVLIEGLEGLPEGMSYAYGPAVQGSAEVHAAIQDLHQRYRAQMGWAADWQAVTRQFEADELRQFVSAYEPFLAAISAGHPRLLTPDIRKMEDVWTLSSVWLSGLPETVVCASGRPDTHACGGYLIVPPGETVEVAVAVVLPRMAGRETGLRRSLELTLVDHAAPPGTSSGGEDGREMASTAPTDSSRNAVKAVARAWEAGDEAGQTAAEGFSACEGALGGVPSAGVVVIDVPRGLVQAPSLADELGDCEDVKLLVACAAGGMEMSVWLARDECS